MAQEGERRMRKRAVVMGLVIVLSLCAAVSAADLTVRVSDASGRTGSTVDVPITVTGAQDLGALDLLVQYDPAVLVVRGVEKGSLTKGMILANTDSPGNISIALIDSQGITGSGPVAVMKFQVTGATGTTSPVTIVMALGNDVETGEEFVMQTGGGTFTVTEEAPAGGTIPGFDAMAALGALGVIGAIYLAGRERRG